MQITLEKQPDCLAEVRVVVPAEKVTEGRLKLVKDYAKQAKIPGYRPGKVPHSVVEQRFKKDIDTEFEKRIIGESLREVREQEELDIISVTDIEGKEYGVDGTFAFLAKLVLTPEFDLPDYSSLSVKVPKVEVTPEDVDKGLEQVRLNFADYEDITDRGAEMDDYIVVDYTGTVDGKPIGEIAAEAPAQVATGEDKWFKMEDETFIPGFCAGLVGGKFEEKRDVTVTMPAEFPHEEIAGKEISYAVEIKGLKKQVLPEMDDDLAEKIKPDTTMDEIRELMEADLLKQRENQVENATTQQIVNQISHGLEFELPKDMVMREAQGRINEIVKQNAQRGLGDDAIAEHQDEIMNSATTDAHNTVRNTFILEAIAKKEEITVDNEELRAHVQQIADSNGMPFEKVAKELDKEGGAQRIHHQMLMAKTLDFLKSNASVEILTLEELQAAEAAQQG
ncbi:MAG: trigger factor [Verrucomicrobiales bacterium]|jgi:trigger factor